MSVKCVLVMKRKYPSKMNASNYFNKSNMGTHTYHVFFVLTVMCRPIPLFVVEYPNVEYESGMLIS